MSNSNGVELVKSFVMGVGLTNDTEENILEYIVKNIPQQSKSYYIVTPNPEMVVLANKDKEFKRVLNNAQIALTDGMQLYRSARMMGIPLKERIIGTNFVEKLCEKVADRPITVGFLGGRPGVAERAVDCLKEKFPDLKVVFVQEEWSEDRSLPHFSETFNSKKKKSSSSLVSLSEIRPQSERDSQSFSESNFNSLQNEQAPSYGSKYYALRPMPAIDILFVAYGFPKQEKWMAEHVGKIPVKVMMGVGGALDQIVDPSLRPPAAVHNAGLGWLYRLVREPWRFKRQAKLLEFVRLAVQARLTQS